MSPFHSPLAVLVDRLGSRTLEVCDREEAREEALEAERMHDDPSVDAELVPTALKRAAA